jgi:carbamoyl-phosphate synthase large subunit
MEENKRLTIMLSSAGRRVELLNCFRTAAEKIGCHLKIIAIDAAPEWSPACQIADAAYQVPKVTTRKYVDVLKGICKKHGVRLIVPTIDTELIVYAEFRKLFEEIGTEILLSHQPVVSITRDKLKTSEILVTHGIKTPKSWPAVSLRDKRACPPFPLIIKPVNGSCSNGIFFANTIQEMLDAKVNLENYVAQEVCNGDEYTINAFYDRNGKWVACVPHLRKFVRSGEVCFAETKRVPEFTNIAKKLQDIFQALWGNICFQGFLDPEDGATVFEINARFGGGYPVCDKSGGTYAKWILQDLLGEKPEYNDDWQDGLRMLRYDAAIFIPNSK